MGERETKTQRATAQLLTPAIWGIGIALGCVLAWPLMAFQSMNLYAGFDNREAILDQAYLLSIVATTATLAACGLFHKSFDRVLGSVFARWVFPAGMAIGTLLILGAGAPGAAGTAFAVGFGLATGVFSGLFLMNFGAVIGMLSIRQSAAAIAIGYLLSSVLFFAFLFFGQLEATLMCASMGPVAGVFLFYGVSDPKMDKRQANSLPAQADPDDADKRQLHSLILAFGLTMLVAGASYELSRTLYVQMGHFAAGAVTPYAVAQGAVTTLTAVGSISVALVLITSRGIKGPEVVYRLITTFLLIGALLLPVPLLFPEVPAFVPLSIDVAAFQCLGMGM